MPNEPHATAPAALPADDLARLLVLAQSDSPDALHIGLVGDTYTILLGGKDTAGKFCLIDMHVPPGGGPPPHRHDFEEMFSLLEGALEFTFRGKTQTVKAPMTVNIPANAPHQFKNSSGATAHLLCMCTPAGQEEFFMAVAVPVASRDAPPPQISKEEQVEKGKLAQQLAPRYRTEMLKSA